MYLCKMSIADGVGYPLRGSVGCPLRGPAGIRPLFGSEIAAHAAAIVGELLPVMLLQKFFFAQDLAVEQPEGSQQVDQQDPMRKNQELADQNERKSDIDGVAAESKNSAGDELIGVLAVDADAEALPI
jgi:hypothetical protein